jgi:hypothetical protein
MRAMLTRFGVLLHGGPVRVADLAELVVNAPHIVVDAP